MDSKIFEVFGRHYQAEPCPEAVCNGCAAYGNTELCHRMPNCLDPHVVFKEVVGSAQETATALARNTDPDTSKAAARRVRGTTIANQIVDHLMMLPLRNFTGTELSTALGIKLNSITPRFAPLLKAGMIRASGFRRDRQIAWEIA